MVSKDKCLNLSVIPQFGGTCWFNAILMIALYSQNVRKAMMKASKKWDKTDSFFMILKSVLIKYYKKPEKVQKFFNKIRPEIILFKMLKKMGEYDQLEHYKRALKKDKANLGWYEDFIIPFLRYMNVNTLDIVYVNHQYYLETYNEFYYKDDPVTGQTMIYITHMNDYTNPKFVESKRKEVFKDVTNKLKNVPDVLIVKHGSLNKQVVDLMLKYNYIGQMINEFKNDKYNFDVRGIDTYDDIIYLNGHKYKLDAVTLTNYDKVAMNHAIAGITCNGNRYVYNGWNSATTDPALVNKNYAVSEAVPSPCSLMPYDWDLRKDDDFCLNPKSCQLDFFNPLHQNYLKMLCFSFAKGRRILIYVRVVDDDKESELIPKGSIPETLKLSGVSGVIKDVHDIKNLSDQELIVELQKFKIYLIPNVHYDRWVLESLYYDLLKKHYNYNPILKQSVEKKSKSKSSFKIKTRNLTKIVKKEKPQTKIDIIKMILDKYPGMKNLTSKNKNQLLAILHGKIETKVKNKALTKNELIELVKKKIPALKGLAKLTKAQLEALISVK